MTLDEAIAALPTKAQLDALIVERYGISKSGISGTHRANMMLSLVTLMSAWTKAQTDAVAKFQQDSLDFFKKLDAEIPDAA